MSKTGMAAGNSVKNPKLHLFLKNTRIAREATQSLLSRLSQDQLFWKPDGGTWSIAQCFDHIATTTGLYIPKLRKAIESARKGNKKGGQPLKAGIFARWFIKSVGPSSKVKLSSPKIFRPAQTAPEDAGEACLKVLDELEALILEADNWNLNKPRFPPR